MLRAKPKYAAIHEQGASMPGQPGAGERSCRRGLMVGRGAWCWPTADSSFCLIGRRCCSAVTSRSATRTDGRPRGRTQAPRDARASPARADSGSDGGRRPDLLANEVRSATTTGGRTSSGHRETAPSCARPTERSRFDAPSASRERQVGKSVLPCKAGADLHLARNEVESVTTAPTGSYRGVWKSPPQSFQTPRSAFSARCSACLNGCTFSNGLCW